MANGARTVGLSNRVANTYGHAGENPISPNDLVLPGKNKVYRIQRVKDIKSSVCNNGITSVMNSNVNKVRDEAIEAISTYLSNVR